MEFFESFFTAEVLWIIFGIILLLLEFTTPGFFLMFFGFGAIVVGIVCLIFKNDPDFAIQLLIFIAASLGSLFSLRRWMKKVFTGHSKDDGELDDTDSSFIGEKAIVTQKITPELPGQVELHGTLWKAESDVKIDKKTPVRIVGKSNLLLTVEPINKK